MQNALRDTAMVEVKSRVLEACLTQAALPDGMPIDVLVNDTLHHEKKRLETDKKSPTAHEDAAFWDGVKARLGHANDSEIKDILGTVIGRFADEIRGNFSAPLYQLATRVMPRALPMLLNAMSPKRLLQRGVPDIGDTIQIQGDLEAVRAVQKHGTLILTPTHVSNLDSPVIGWAIYAMGLPPFTYGAGLNLFSNPVMSLFMRNLGAYRVDRLKTAPLYKDVLKEYATMSLELGQPNLFFPAGTRVRSNRIEQKLKLGLLSSGLRAYINNLQRPRSSMASAARSSPNIYIVPCTLNYHLTLEAETLIEDHLQREGKSRYIITDDESYLPRKILQFTQNLLSLDSRIVVEIAPPIDPFGNRVDPATGESVDRHGRVIDIRRYVTDRSGQPVHLPQRDRIYTQEAGEAIARAFLAHNVVVSTQLVAFVAWEVLRARAAARGGGSVDLYRFLRSGDDGTGLELGRFTELVHATCRVLATKAEAGAIKLDRGPVQRGDATEIIQSALRHFASYHTRAVLVRKGDRLFANDMKLLLYYSNRLRGYALEKELAPLFREGGA